MALTFDKSWISYLKCLKGQIKFWCLNGMVGGNCNFNSLRFYWDNRPPDTRKILLPWLPWPVGSNDDVEVGAALELRLSVLHEVLHKISNDLMKKKYPGDFYRELQPHDGTRLAVTNLLALLDIRGRVGVFRPVRLRLLPWDWRHFLL